MHSPRYPPVPHRCQDGVSICAVRRQKLARSSTHGLQCGDTAVAGRRWSLFPTMSRWVHNCINRRVVQRSQMS